MTQHDSAMILTYFAVNLIGSLIHEATQMCNLKDAAEIEFDMLTRF